MTHFDLACLLIPHSSPTIISMSLTVTVYEAGAQAAFQAARTPAVHLFQFLPRSVFS